MVAWTSEENVSLAHRLYHRLFSDKFGTIEGVKGFHEVFCPVSGDIIEVNALLHDRPELVNDSYYEKGKENALFSVVSSSDFVALLTSRQKVCYRGHITTFLIG